MLSQLTGSATPQYTRPLFGTDGQIDLAALATAGGDACGSSGPSVETAGFEAAPPPVTQAQAATGGFNAAGIEVERLSLAENESGGDENGPVIGFLPYPDRFAVENDRLFMLAYSVAKGFELAEVKGSGGVKVHNFNPGGDSFAGYPYYDDRTIKAFGGHLFFYALGADGQFEFSSLKAGSAVHSVDADPEGSDIRVVRGDYDPVEPGPGVFERSGVPLIYQATHIESFKPLRGRLLSAASLRIPVVDPDSGEAISGALAYDIEPQRVSGGKSPAAEVVDMYPGGTSLPRNMVEFNGAVYMIAKVEGGFAPCAEGRDYELVRLNDDGSSETIEINADGWAFFPSVGYPEMTVFNGALYLVANVDGSEAGRHELVRVSAAHEVSVIPLNPDGAAFPDDSQLRSFWTGANIPAAFRQFGPDLIVLGARVKGECYPGDCGNPYENEALRISPAGVVSVIDFTPGPGTTFDTFLSRYLPPTFVASEFDGDLYFNCQPCNNWSLFRLNADGSQDNLVDWVVTPVTADNRNFAMGVERAGSYYMAGFNQNSGEEGVLKIAADGTLSLLTSADMGYSWVNNLTLYGNLIVGSADIFTSPDRDFEHGYLGTELLLVHPDDSLGYIDVRPGLDAYDWPLMSRPQSLHVVDGALFFSSYGDDTWTSPYNDLYRLKRVAPPIAAGARDLR